MTKEELKVHCEKQIKECEMWAKYKGEEPSGKIYEEHKLILELLDQEPCEDAISRQAVLDKKELVELDDGQSFYSISPEDVETLPSVTSKSKTGHWTDGHCSECGCDVPAYIDDWKWQKDMDAKYCPNCGAKMGESEGKA